MKPKFISAENFKGRDFQHDLRTVTVFVGANDSGKTAILDAVRVALLGYHPNLGKQNIDTIKLAGENRLDMNVTLGFEDDLVNSWTWRRNAKNEIKKTEKVDIKDVPAVMLDLREYLSCTKKERIAEITKRFAIESKTVNEEAILAEIEKIEVLPANERDGSIADLKKVFEKSARRRKTSKTSLQEWLPELVREIDEERKSYSTKATTLGAQMGSFRNSGAAPKSVAATLRRNLRNTPRSPRVSLNFKHNSARRRTQRSAKLNSKRASTPSFLTRARKKSSPRN